MKIRPYEISRIVDYMKELLEDDAFLCGILAQGEISNFRKHSSGHLYFSIKDEASALRCAMFAGEAKAMIFAPKDGDFVQVYGRISLYKRSGDVQFIVEFMNPAGEGKIAQDLDQLKRKLDEEGVFSNCRPMPVNPRKIVVVSSSTGAAVVDVIRTAQRRNPLVKIAVVSALVQGEGAAEDIARGIGFANANSLGDVLIVGRGGGSAEDLAAFNSEVVARAVYGSAIPVVSAVGHEIDVTLCDFAADLRASTPTAAAELVVQPVEELWAAVRLRRDALFEIISDKIKENRFLVSSGAGRLKGSLTKRIDAAKSALAGKIEVLDKISPMNVLGRGFVLALDESGNRITSANLPKFGQDISLHFADGVRGARIND